jgi:hypothetical protein
VNSEEVKLLAKQAAQLSQQAVELNKQGKRLEGYALMQQAVEAARKSRQLMNQPKIKKVLTQLEQNGI